MTRDRSGEWEINEIRLWVLNTESLYRVEQELAHVYARQMRAGLFNEERALDDITNNIVIPAIQLKKSFDQKIWTNKTIRREAAKRVLEIVKEEIDEIMKEEKEE